MMTFDEARKQVLEQARLGALRWLHGLDLDVASRTYGVADREYWAWKTKDFANGTWQGGLAGFLDVHGLLPLDSKQVRRVVEACLEGTSRIQRSDGSFEEAYPRESSFAVTSLVLFDLLYAYFRHVESFSPSAESRLREIATHALRFLSRTPETHGVISNHLCTDAVARYLAHCFLKEPVPRDLFGSLLSLQDPEEGWFPEYGGSDPGYQLLLNHYLCAAHLAKPLPEDCGKALERSLRFCEEFCFPDGSYAGEVGSRGTSTVYPGGTLGVTPRGCTASPLLGWLMTLYVERMSAVTPTCADAGNFVPVFNSWALLAAQLLTGLEAEVSYHPDQPSSAETKVFKNAGITRVVARDAFVVVSSKTGAIRRVTRSGDGRWRDGSLVAFVHPTGLTTQGVPVSEFKADSHGISFALHAAPRRQPLNDAMSATVLRGIGWALYRTPSLQRALKKSLAGFVMGEAKSRQLTVARVSIDIHDPGLVVKSRLEDSAWSPKAFGFDRHMASANTFDPRAL